MTTSPRRPEGRYDEPRRLPRQLTYVLAALLGLLLLSFSYAAYNNLAGRSASGTILGYAVLSDTEIEVRVQVRHSGDAKAQCVIVAYDRDHATVGHRTVTIEPQDADPTQLTLRLPTTGRAATAQVTGCSP